MFKMKSVLYGLAVAGFLSAAAGFAQNTNSADLSGSVTDVKGALIPGATVTIKDVDKDTERAFTTDNAGLYDTGSIVPDHYLVTVSAPGFKTYVRGPINLDVGTQTLNAILDIGAVTEQVVVTTDLPLLDTSDGSQTDTLSSESMAQLPQYGSDWENFVFLLPGSSFSYRAGQSTSINGNLPYSSILADGATTTLPMSTNSDVTVFETTAEVKVDANAFSAQYGLGGIIFNQITKSGTDHFHGSAYEYFQNNALNAADYAFGNGGKPAFQRYDNYGFSVGGPVPLPYFKHKLFFYFDYDKTYSNGGSGNQFDTVPTDAEKTGDFTGMPTIYDYTTQVLTNHPATTNPPVGAYDSVTRESFADEFGQGNKIPTGYAGLSTVAAALQKFFPEPNVTTGTITTSLGLPFNNYFTNVPNLAPFTKYFGRLDYTPVQSHRFTISETESDNPAISYGNGKQLCPINCQFQDVSRDNAQVSDVWTISSSMVNEARFGFTDQLNFFSPFSLNENYPQKLGTQWTVANTFPNFDFNNYLGLGSPTNAVYKEFVFDPSDVFTLIKGRHVLHFGGEVLINRADSTAWGNENSASVDFQGYYTDYGLNQQVTVPNPKAPTPQSTDPTDYADFLLGYSAEWYGQNDPEFGARMKNPQAFVQDDIKLRPNLTINVGLRWYGTTGFTEVKGNIAAFDPTIINPGTDSNGNTNTLGAAWYAYSHANGRTHLQAPIWSTFLPRFGFSYSRDPKTVLRGGIGLYNYTWSEDTYGGGMGNALGLNTGEFDNSGGIDPVLLLDSNGSTNYQQGYGLSVAQLETHVNPTGPAGYNGTGMSYNMYHTPVPKIWQYNLTLQRELGTTMMAQVAYVGSKGWNLNFPVDINQVPENELSATDTTPKTNERPYPNFTGLGGSTNNASSNYNSLQAQFQKRLGHGLQFTAAYTWSKFLDSQDSSGWGSSAGSQDFQSSYCVKCNWGPSNFDVRHVFTFSGVYTLPFGRGAQFLNKSYVEDLVLGGWRLAATSRENTGSPFTPTMSTSTTNAQAGNQFPDLIGNPLSAIEPAGCTNNPQTGAPGCDPTWGGQQAHVHTIQNWFNKYAYAAPTSYTYGDVRRNSLYGPDYGNLNLSFGKTFDLYKSYRLEIRADAQNALNHASFNAPDSGIGDSKPAVITGVTDGGRHIQLYGKFTF
jgi:hypothetical protein